MYNSDFPTRAELPTHAQLKRSTLIAAASALAILVTIVFPSEYGVDVTGVGGLLRLTEMGQIKTQLAQEAASDRMTTAATPPQQPVQQVSQAQVALLAERVSALEKFFFDGQASGSAAPQPGAVTSISEPASPDDAQAADQNGALSLISTGSADAAKQSDEMNVVLGPGEGTEIKMVMDAGAKANFWWSANGGQLNFDAHGDGGGQSVSYEKGRGIGQDEGVMTASFSGNHGWFWRNRTSEPVTLTLRTNGTYAQLKRMK